MDLSLFHIFLSLVESESEYSQDREDQQDESTNEINKI
jgi:hypothetical protein